MPTVTPQKLLLISMVIVLGAAAASLLPASKVLTSNSPVLYVTSTDTPRIKSARRTPQRNAHHQIVERMPVPYLGVSGTPYDRKDLEFDY